MEPDVRFGGRQRLILVVEPAARIEGQGDLARSRALLLLFLQATDFRLQGTQYVLHGLSQSCVEVIDASGWVRNRVASLDSFWRVRNSV